MQLNVRAVYKQHVIHTYDFYLTIQQKEQLPHKYVHVLQCFDLPVDITFILLNWQGTCYKTHFNRTFLFQRLHVLVPNTFS